MEQFQAIGQKILSVLLPYGVKRVALFGSIARGDHTPESDIDILVAFKEPVGLFTLAHLRQELGVFLFYG